MKIKKRLSLLYIWIGTYLLVLLLPIVGTALYYHQSVDALMYEYEQENLAALKGLRTTLDTEISSLVNIVNNIANAQIISEYSAPAAGDSLPYTNREIQNMFLDDYYQQKGISNLFIWFTFRNYFLSANGIYRERDYAKIAETIGISKDDLQKRLNANNFRTVFISSGETGQSTITIFQRIRYNSYFSKGGYVILVADAASLMQTMEGCHFYDDQSIQLIDNQNFSISVGDSSYPPGTYFTYASLAESPEWKQTATLGGQEYLVLNLPSSCADIQYVSLLPLSRYNALRNRQRTFIMIGIGSALVVGLFLAYFFSRRNYGRLLAIGRTLGLVESDTNTVSGTEFDQIQQTVGNLVDDYHKNLRQSKKMVDKLRESAIRELLQGIELSREELAKLGVEFPFDGFLNMIIRVDSEEFSGENPEEARDLSLFAVRNIGMELLSSAPEEARAFCDQADNRVIFIINTLSDNVVYRMDRLLLELQQIQTTMQKDLHISTSIFVSDIERPPIDGNYILPLRDSHDKAEELLNHYTYLGIQGGIYSSKDLPEIRTTNYESITNLGDMWNIMKLISECDFTAARLEMNKLFDAYYYRRESSYEDLRFQVNGLSYGVIGSLLDIQDPSIKELINDIRPVDKILAAKNIPETISAIIDIFDALEAGVAKSKATENSLDFSLVLDYIRRNSGNPDLSGSSIAAQFNMSPSAFSRQITRETGKSYPDYIHGIRVENVCRYLKETDLTINEIAEKTGFYSSRTLTRAFKSIMGITPGEYRKTLKESA